MVKIKPLSPEVLKEIEKATPPPKFPRGYFDPMITPMRKLLDRGLTAPQAADFLIQRNALKPGERKHFLAAMKGRISRLTRDRVAAGGTYIWSANLFHDSTHLVLEGERKAICGATASVWEKERTESNRCARCVGLGRRNNLVVEQGNNP